MRKRITKFEWCGRNWITVLPAVILFWLAGAAQPAWAVQGHGGTEGLVSHEIGHVLFIAGMVFILAYLSRQRFRSSAWLKFRCFLYLIILWNILTFTGHYMREYVGPEQMHKVGGRTVAFAISDLPDAYFYLTRLDHLLLVPALLFLLLALKQWRVES
ncbi:MAG: hypothetical protein N2C12_17585 [Planctomycetales bacterium]